MALAHQTAGPPPLEQRRMAFDFAQRVGPRLPAGVLMQNPPPEFCEAFGVPSGDHVMPAIPPVVRARFGDRVEPGNGRREGRINVRPERVPRCQTIEQLIFVEPVHLDEPVDGCSRPPNRQRLIGAAHDRHDTTVDARRGATIEAKLPSQAAQRSSTVEQSR